MKAIIRSSFIFLLLFSFIGVATAGFPVLTAPTNSSNGSYTLSPNAPEAPFFLTDIWKRVPNGTWQPFKITYGSQSATDVVAQTGIYEYKSRWYNPSAQNIYSQYSNFSSTVFVNVIISAPPVQAPNLGSSVTVNQLSYAISWSAVPGATYYIVEQELPTSIWQTVGNSSASTYSFTNANGSYSYRAKACNSFGCGPTSPVKTVTVQFVPPPPPPPPTVLPFPPTYVAIVAQGIVTWGTVVNATYYEAQNQLPSSTTWTTFYSGPGGGARFITGGTRIRVRSCNQLGCSGWAYN